MDFWSRLIGGTNAPAGNKHASPKSLQERLANFKRVHIQLQELWQKTGLRPSNGSAGLLHLRNLNRILQEETHSAAPHMCMQYVATSQAFNLIALIGSASLSAETTREAIRFFSLVIDSEEEDFLEDEAFADQLISFVHAATTGANNMIPDTETEPIELLFTIAAKLRQRPTIPVAWFRLSRDTTRKRPSQTSVSIPKSQEFPLMDLLLGYVHNNGKIGDFARTGLLYILELAGRADKLEKWIIESELATMMASGLGALYSQLSSKVSLSYPADSKPPVLAFSDVIEPDHQGDAEPIFSTTLQANLSTFASFLNFWQDVLERCPSDDIKATLLDHFDFLFLRPLLYVLPNTPACTPPNAQSRYPSLVESSDNDSGSSVAVLTYLTYILEKLNETSVIRLLLRYMLAAPAQPSPVKKPSRPSTLAQRRKSETLISNNAHRSDDPSPDLVTLTNILHCYLMSRNQQTVTASLRLLATLLRSWHEFANTTLMKIQSSHSASSKRPKSMHDQQLNVLYSLAEDLLDDEALEALYESHLQDAQIMLETHPCSAPQLLFPYDEILEKIVPKKRSIQRMIIPDDLLVTCLLSLLENFLVNDIEVNLSLSETLATLASCKETSLEGWLMSSPSEALVDDGAKNEDRRESTGSSRKEPDASPVFARLESLVERIDRLRQDIQDFDIHLSERRHIFKVGGEIDDILAGIPSRKSHESHGQRKRSAQKDRTAVSSISGRLEASRDVSRSTSPRGRQGGHSSGNYPQPKSVVGHLSHLHLSPSPSSSSPLERTYSPSPLRAQSISTTASSRLPSPRGPPDALRQKIRLKITTLGSRGQPRGSGGSETSSLYSESVKAGSAVVGGGEEKEISLSHLLTNVIILQEFILELAAIIQVRASLFGEVGL
ncbi:MAG: hypothetical protein Q9173_002121 [Seirophora scorigena]